MYNYVTEHMDSYKPIMPSYGLSNKAAAAGGLSKIDHNFDKGMTSGSLVQKYATGPR